MGYRTEHKDGVNEVNKDFRLIKAILKWKFTLTGSKEWKVNIDVEYYFNTVSQMQRGKMRLK